MSQHDSTTPPPPGTPGAPYGGPTSGLSGRGTTFFTWMRGLGIVRTEGWLGGVCAGVANRIGIDPLIVRGIVVVAAILGAPMLLIYAAAWALLPDRENRIHLQRLFDGDFQPAIVGIGVLALLSLLPWAPGIWWADGGFWGSPSIGDVIGRVVWTLIVLALIAGLIVWAVRGNWGRDAWSTNHGTGTGAGNGAGAGASSSGAAAAGGVAGGVGGAPGAPGPGVWTADAAGTATGPETAADAAGAASTTTSAPDAGAPDALGTPDAADTVPLDSPADAAETDASATKPLLDVTAEPTEPPAPTVGASQEDVDGWRTRHASWQAEHAQWKARLDEDMRAVKRQRAAEMRAQASVATAEAAAQRRAYRAANPRIGAAFGWATIGLALVAAAIVSAIWEPTTGLTGYGVTAALAAATLVFGVATLIAGLARRRSGFLIFLGILLAVVTLVTAWVPRSGQIVFDGAWLRPTGNAQYAQPFGDTTIVFEDALESHRGTPVVDFVKGGGTTTLLLGADKTVSIVATTRGQGISVGDADGGRTEHTCTTSDDDRLCTVDLMVGPSKKADAIVRVQQFDQVVVQQNTEEVAR